MTDKTTIMVDKELNDIIKFMKFFVAHVFGIQTSNKNETLAVILYSLFEVIEEPLTEEQKKKIEEFKNVKTQLDNMIKEFDLTRI